ncbi:PTS sugar transporter subunit IIA, partial [Escherichia coli]|uniref:PTS sugar transporter subunit IIA n=1 Tax=Escherichia coli TaxID=562 RepID=UPI0021C6964D
TGGTADRNRSHWSTSKTPSYTKSVSWQHHRKDEPIKLLIGLSAADANSHIGAIQALSELLCEEEILEQLLTASSEKQLADIISRG